MCYFAGFQPFLAPKTDSFNFTSCEHPTEPFHLQQLLHLHRCFFGPFGHLWKSQGPGLGVHGFAPEQRQQGGHLWAWRSGQKGKPKGGTTVETSMILWEKPKEYWVCLTKTESSDLFFFVEAIWLKQQVFWSWGVCENRTDQQPFSADVVVHQWATRTWVTLLILFFLAGQKLEWSK